MRHVPEQLKPVVMTPDDVQPVYRAPRPFIERPRQQVIMSHPEAVTLPPTQEQPKKPAPILKPILTPNLDKSNLEEPKQADKAPSQDVPPMTFSGPFPTKMTFVGRGKGRERTFFETIELLVYRREKGVWPNGLKPGMQNYYKGAYPEYFAAGKRAEQKRAANQQKADRLRAENRPRRRNVKSVLHPDGHGPIDLQSRRRASS